MAEIRRPGTTLQTLWGWKHAAYLFTAGTGAGTYMIGASAALDPAWIGGAVGGLCMWLGVVLIAISVGFLIADLGRPERFFRVLLKARRSWLSRGSWILIAFTVTALLALLTGTPPWLAVISLVSAASVATYTGLLLGTMLVRSLWNNPLLPVLFLASALATGIAWVGVGGLVVAGGIHMATGGLIRAMAVLRPLQVVVLAAEVLLLYFYLAVAYGRSRSAADLLVRGAIARSFWVGVMAIGIGLPVALDLLAGGTRSSAVEVLADVCVLIGGYVLRRTVLYAGVRTPVNLGRPFVIRPEV